MKNIYLVCYDIADPTRWKVIFKTMKGYADAVQFSVFRCTLTPEAYVTMKRDLSEHMHTKEDKILIADLGPMEGRGDHALVALGKPIAPVLRGSIIL